MTHHLVLVALTAALPVLRGAGAHEDEGVAAAEERARAFAWFSGLGFPDVKGCAFVHVATGQSRQRPQGPPQNTHRFAFLLEEKGDSFTVFTTDLATLTFRKTARDVPEHTQVGYAAADLPQLAREYLQFLRKPEEVPDRLWRRFGERLTERAEVFVLAWACSRLGHDSLAVDLYDQAARMPARNPGTLRQAVAEEIGLAEMWRAVLEFGDTSRTRTQLLERFEKLVKNFPDTRHAGDARQTVAILTRMIEEDRAHADRRQQGKPFNELDRAEQIAELIFQLRDQRGQQWSQPGSCDIFETADKDSPAHRLVNMGYDAVPQLIAALEDERFSRSVGFHRNFYFSHYVLRIGDCAERILVRIAERPFYEATHTAGYMLKDRKGAETKKMVEEWYHELKTKGEKVMLMWEAAKGAPVSAHVARRLVAKYPDAALPALVQGVRSSTLPWVRQALVGEIGRLDGAKAQSFLLQELKDGPTQACRCRAASALHAQNRPEGVAAMISEWQQSTSQPGDTLAPQTVARFLATSGRTDAIKALAKDFGHKPVDLRLNIIREFGHTTSGHVVATGQAEVLTPPAKASVADSPKDVRVATIDLVVSALNDTEERTGMSGTWNGKSFSNPRICDIAGHVLNQLDAARFPFDLAAPLAERDRSRVILQNAWRKDKGLAPLP